MRGAHKYIHAGIGDHRPHTQQAIYKVVRLLNIIIYYELRETDYLEYEIRSYTRYFKQKSSLTKCEKLVFRTIQLRPYANSTAKNALLCKKITNYDTLYQG